MFDQLLIFLGAFFFIWIGSGLIVSSADKISKTLNVSSFALSFCILGQLTSVPEYALGISAISAGDPEIMVGNLLGGIVVMFLFVIPLLAIFGNGVSIKNEFDRTRILASLAVIALPSFFMLDHKISILEAIVLIVSYGATLFLIQMKNGMFSKQAINALGTRQYSFYDIAKVLIGISIVFLASNIAIDKTMYFSEVFSISPFYLSLIVLSIGTNLPELSLALRGVIQGKKDVAFGDYLGSAATNAFILGLLTLVLRGNIVSVSGFHIVFIFTVLALTCFYFFARSDNKISRTEGFILLLFYILFILFELLR
jgi:cation:H+ antiporter